MFKDGLMKGNENLGSLLNELGRIPVFQGKSEEQILSLCQGGEIVSYPHRSVVFETGEDATYFGLILTGALKMSRTSRSGEDVIMHFSTAGDFVALFILSGPNPVFPVTASAIGSVQFLKIPKATYLEGWKAHPDLILKTQEHLAGRLTQLHDQKVMSKAPLEAKVAMLLMTLLNRNPDEKGFVNPPLTRKEIAETLGSAVESIIRIMSDWSKMGYVQTTARQIQVLNPEKLIELIGKAPS